MIPRTGNFHMIEICPAVHAIDSQPLAPSFILQVPFTELAQGQADENGHIDTRIKDHRRTRLAA